MARRKPKKATVSLKVTSSSGRDQANRNYPQSIACAPSSSGAMYGNMDEASLNGDYLTLVVQATDGNWRYVRVNSHCLDCVGIPIVFDKSDGPSLLEVWKKVVIDNAIPWEDSVRTDTLRIVTYKHSMEDVTSTFFNDGEEAKECVRRAALAKLSVYEAKILGLGKTKFTQTFFRDSAFDQDTKKSMQNLAKNSASISLNTLLSNLSE